MPLPSLPLPCWVTHLVGPYSSLYLGHTEHHAFARSVVLLVNLLQRTPAKTQGHMNKESMVLWHANKRPCFLSVPTVFPHLKLKQVRLATSRKHLYLGTLSPKEFLLPNKKPIIYGCGSKKFVQ